MSFLQFPSVLFSFLRFLYFCGPDYLGAWNRLLYTPQSFSSPELRSFWPAPSGELWLAGGQKGPCKTRSSAHLQRSETMTITIDYNKETFCACMLSWSQKELQLLLIRGADDKERSSGERNESMLSQRKPGPFKVLFFRKISEIKLLPLPAVILRQLF